MSDKNVHPAVTVGCALFAVCLMAALWTGEWRLVPTGFVVLLLSAIVANTRRSR